jgi:hypothetical protein
MKDGSLLCFVVSFEIHQTMKEGSFLRFVVSFEIHQTMKEGSLLCFVVGYEIHQTRMPHIVFLVSLESFQQGGVHGLVP